MLAGAAALYPVHLCPSLSPLSWQLHVGDMAHGGTEERPPRCRQRGARRSQVQQGLKGSEALGSEEDWVVSLESFQALS